MPAPSLFALELAAGRKSAVDSFRSLLSRHNGNLAAAARELGVHPRTFQSWRQRMPAVETAIRELGQSQADAVAVARAARAENRAKKPAKRAPRKKIKKAS